MKKFIVNSVLVILCFSIMVAFIPGVLAQTNILPNPGFENSLNSWTFTPGTATYSIDSISHSGGFSVRGFEIEPSDIGRLYQDVTTLVTPGDQCKISGWIKTYNVTGSVVIALDYVASGYYTPIDGYITEIGHVNGTHDWAFFESSVFTVPPMPSDSIALYFLFDFNAGAGTAWWDDVSLTLISQPHITPTVGWPMFGHDLTNARYSSSTAPRTNQVLWSSTLDNQVRTAATVSGDKAYVGSFSGNVYALDARTGSKVWNFSTGAAVWSSPTFANGIVYVGSNNGVLYALNATAGTKIWSFTTGSGVYSSPSVVGDIVYVGSTDNNIYALDAHTGTKIWNYTTGGQIRCSPAVVNGVVYVGSQDGNLYALNATTGVKIWSSHTGDGDTYTNSSPAVVNGTVYVGSTDKNLYAFEASNGRQIWNYPTGAKVSSSPAVFNGVVYVGSEDGNLHAVDSSAGTKVWTQTTGGPVYSSPAVADGLVYVGSWDNTIYAFDVSTGALVWSYKTGGGVFSSPTVAGGVIFVGSYDGKVYAFGSSYSPGASSPGTSGSSNRNLNTTAWVPPVPNGAAACIVTAGAVSAAALVIAAVSSTSASATGGFLDKLISKVRNLLPKTVKKWLEDVITSKRKLKIEAKTGSPYLLTKSEIVVYTVSVLVLTFSFAYAEVIDFHQFLLVLPTFFATSILVALIRTYIISVWARKRGVWTEFKLWYLGVGMFLVSTLAFRTPFSSPTKTVHHSLNFTERLGVLLSCAGIFITLGFAGLFFILLKSGFALIGGTGLAMCLIAAFFDTFPIEPMSGKDIYKYNKPLWVSLFLITLALYGVWLVQTL